MNDRAPSDITTLEMEILADNLEAYLGLLEDVFVVPDSIRDSEKAIRKNIDRVHELIRRLRDGDRGVFKDDEDCDLL